MFAVGCLEPAASGKSGGDCLAPALLEQIVADCLAAGGQMVGVRSIVLARWSVAAVGFWPRHPLQHGALQLDFAEGLPEVQAGLGKLSVA